MGEANLDVGDDGHGLADVVEGLEQNVGSSTVHGTKGACELAHQFKGLFGKVDPDVAGVANVVKQVAQRVEAGFLDLELAGVADTQQGLKVGEGDCWWGG